MKNIEEIIKKIKEQAQTVKKGSKYDAITIEYTVKNDIKRTDSIKEIKEICKKLKLKPISIEENNDTENIYILQFPEFVPQFTEKQISKMYKDSFIWLLENVKGNKEDITPLIIQQSRDVFVRQAITMYYRSNVNQYKETLDSYLLNSEYINKINLYFKDFYKDYFNEE